VFEHHRQKCSDVKWRARLERAMEWRALWARAEAFYLRRLAARIDAAGLVESRVDCKRHPIPYDMAVADLKRWARLAKLALACSVRESQALFRVREIRRQWVADRSRGEGVADA
jgi:hypothetical protein